MIKKIALILLVSFILFHLIYRVAVCINHDLRIPEYEEMFQNIIDAAVYGFALYSIYRYREKKD